MCSGYGMRRIFVFTLLASAISGSAFAQSPQLEYSNPTTGQPYAVQVTPAQQNYLLPPPHYIVPPPHYVAPPHYVVRQGGDPAATPNASPPPAPWNSRGGGLLQGIFGGPTVTAHAPPYQPGYAPDAPAAYTSLGQGDTADYPVDPKYLRQVVSYDGGEKPGAIIIDTPNKFLYLIEDDGKALRYGIGVGRPGFLWAGVKTITAKREWPDWRPPTEMIARQPGLSRFMPGGSTIRSARARSISARAFTASMARTSLGPSAPTCPPAASACATRMSSIFMGG